jgi:outer membrane receptor protein involved in Fe transport
MFTKLTCKWRSLSPLLPVLVLPLFLGLSSKAAAQEPTATPQTAEEQEKARIAAEIARAEKEGRVRTTEEVTVTGSLIPRNDLEGLSPVAVVSLEEVTYQGTGRVEDLIQQLPQAFAAQNSTISNGASGTATVQLRNLGAVRTLSLLNGRRMAAGDAFSPSSDLNFIPSSLVKRVDVLTGGAGAAYGADAVAGVVNFILDTEFEGFRGDIQWNGFQHNNNNSIAQGINKARGFEVPSGNTFNNGGTNFTLAVGGKLDGGKGHASAFIDYRDIKAILKDERDYTNCSVQTPGATGPACGGSATWQYGRFITDSGDYVLDPNTGNTSTFRPRAGADVYNFAPANFMQRNDRKWGGGAFASYRYSDKVEPYTEVQFMDDYSDAQIAPSGDFGSTSTINCDNPMLSAQQRELTCGSRTTGDATMIILRRNVEGGNRISNIRHISWRALAGVRGDFNPAWNYDVYAMNANVNSPQGYVNDLSVDRITDALDVVGTPGQPDTWRCRSGNPGCVPWNIFTTGSATKAAADSIALNMLLGSSTNTKVVNGTVRGDLEDAGVKFPSATEAVQVALGGEFRREAMNVNPDEAFAVGLGAGQGGPTNAVDGNYVSREGFAEAVIPLVQDRSGFQDLNLNLGYRFASYKASSQSSKTNHSFKAMLSWTPTSGVRIRGGFNRAVRAPNVRELFLPQGLGLGGSEDICAGSNPTATAAQCANTGVSAAQYGRILENPAGQYNSLDGGNPQLGVESADTLTAGLVWTPKSVTGLAVTVDYFDIKIGETISSFAPDDVIKSCAETGNPDLCGLIQRDSFGTLWLATDGYTVSTNQNIGELRARGVDLGVNYPWNLGDHGFIAFSLLGSTMLENRLTTPLTDYDCAGFMGNQCGIPNPKWRHRARASWNTNGKATVSFGWRYIHGVKNDDLSDNPDLGNPGLVERLKLNGSDEFPAFHWFDLAGTYKFKDGVRLTLGVNNILDKEPPLGSGLSDIDYGPGYYGTYDPMGRSLFANLQFEF